MTRDLLSVDVEEIVGHAFLADRLVDVSGLDCHTCGALVRNDWMTRLKHANWHVKNGDVNV